MANATISLYYVRAETEESHNLDLHVWAENDKLAIELWADHYDLTPEDWDTTLDPDTRGLMVLTLSADPDIEEQAIGFEAMDRNITYT